MADTFLYLWDISVAIGIFGFGKSGLRLLRVKRAPLAVAGIFGVSLWIALGAWLNLFHLFRPSIFCVLVGIGILLAIFEFFRARASAPAPEVLPAPQFNRSTKLLLGAAIAIIGTMMLGGMRPLAWTVDDMQGYGAMAVKAAQTHSIQPDPFSERRVQTGVGGGNFLDTMMLAEGDFRAMAFIDSTFGLFLYALGLWAIGRRWKVPSAGIAFALLWLPFATLMKMNLTIIYLSAAAFFAALLLFSDTDEDEHFSLGKIIVLGIIVGANCTTKSPNIVFFLPFLITVALLHKLFQPSAKTLIPILLSLLVAVAVFVPWSIANKATAGTYLYPLLGPGIHISAYRIVPTPSQLGIWQQMVVAAAPGILLLLSGLIVTWKVTQNWSPLTRAAAIAYIFASLLAIAITVYGLGGQGVDRYTAPFAMPSILLFLLIVLGTLKSSLQLWRLIGMGTLYIAGVYIAIFINFRFGGWAVLKTVVYEAAGVLPEQPSFMTVLPASQVKKEFDYGARIQASLPPGAIAISTMEPEYLFDFRRNTIFIDDWPGMASPPPGFPLKAGMAEQRQFLAGQGIQYLICSSPPPNCPTTDWDTFFPVKKPHFKWDFFLIHEPSAHDYLPWQTLEIQILCHELPIMWQIAEHSPQVYNDGHVIVARID